ncbi:MAG TPA: alpha/beta fold hydrolase, partial [Solirubrobacteraceae bacterium]|nr:alpha/beta fold hydrolase [Solirubrobacteraceae bacterium]
MRKVRGTGRDAARRGPSERDAARRGPRRDLLYGRNPVREALGAGRRRVHRVWATTAAGLSHRYRVHALDLPGFGSSCKPARASYSARYFADRVVEVMDALD